MIEAANSAEFSRSQLADMVVSRLDGDTPAAPARRGPWGKACQRFVIDDVLREAVARRDFKASPGATPVRECKTMHFYKSDRDSAPK